MCHPPIDPIQVVPYGLSRLQDRLAPHWEAGIDARYAVTPTTAVYGTLYPDFAPIEADQEQINLTRFDLTLPEKRQVFLEGQEQFNQRFATFYSRRIADITAGGKLLGKQGPWTMGFISAQSDPLGTNRPANYTIGRAQRDIFGRSTIAIMGANRRFDGIDRGGFSADAIVWIRSGAFEQIKHDSNYNIYWGHTGVLRSWKVNEALAIEFRNRLNTAVTWVEEFKLFERDFRNRQAGFDIGYNTREYQSISTGLKFGRNCDADYLLWTAAAR